MHTRVDAGPPRGASRDEIVDWLSRQVDPLDQYQGLKRLNAAGASQDVITWLDGREPIADRRVRHQRGLALARLGRTDEAERVAEELLAEGPGDPWASDVHGLAARVLKDRFLATADRRHLQRCWRAYDQGFRQFPSDTYLGINAATHATLAGERAASIERAAAVYRILRRAEAPTDPAGLYWFLATWAELRLLQGYNDDALDLYGEAVSEGRGVEGEYRATWLQAVRIARENGSLPQLRGRLCEVFTGRWGDAAPDEVVWTVISASPVDRGGVDGSKDYDLIRDALASSPHAGRVVLGAHRSAWRPSDMVALVAEQGRRRLSAGVLHYAGHNHPDSGLWLEDDQGGKTSQAYSAEQMEDQISVTGTDVRVVVFCACNSSPQADAITSVVDVPIGFNATVYPADAQVFCMAFHGALARGETVWKALEGAATRLGEQRGAERAKLPYIPKAAIARARALTLLGVSPPGLGRR